MITIYNATETTFTSLGLGALAPTVCEIIEDINGQYELYMEHMIDDNDKWPRLANDRIIKAPTHDGEQLFRIYSAVKNPITGLIEVRARHIFYDLLDNLVEDVRPTIKTGDEAGDLILAGCQYSTPFSFSSDIVSASTAYYIRVNPVQAFIGSALDQAFINRWGGEIRRNNFDISINTRRGSDKGVRIAYGKNLTGLDATEDISSVYTRITPTALDENNIVFYTDAKYYNSPLINNYSRPKIGVLNTGIRVGATVDGTIPYPDKATAKTVMASKAAAAFAAGADKPKLTINVSFIRWQDTDEYKAFSGLYSLDIGDDVTVDYAPLSLTYTLRVVSITWDAVLDKAVSMTLGDLAPNIAQLSASADIDLSALRNDVNGALMEGEVYNGCYINHTDGFKTVAEIGGKTITAKMNSADGFALYDGDTYVGGVAVVNGEVSMVGSKLMNDIGGDCYATIGNYVSGSDTLSGIFIYKKISGTFTLIARIAVYETGAIVIKTSGEASFLLGNNSIWLNDGTVARFLAQSSAFGGTMLNSPNGNNTIGVDNTGVYKTIGGTKTYL